MRILLLNPPSPEGTQYVRVNRCMQKKAAWGGSLWQPLPIMSTSAVLKRAGYEVKMVDAVADEMSKEQAEQLIKEYDPNLLVLNMAVPTVYNDSYYADFAKKNTKAVTIAIGVPGAYLTHELRKHAFDYCVWGDPEYAVLEICDMLAKKKKLPKKSIVKKYGKMTQLRHLVENLDDLPFSDIEGLNLDKYRMVFTNQRMMLVEPGRGCPFACKFCLVSKLYGRRVRYRSAKNFIDEVELYNKKYGIKEFLFWIETVTSNKKYVMEFCNEIQKRGLKIKWMAPSRVDSVDYEMLKKMKDSGCWMLSYGIESIEQNILDAMEKHIKIEQVINAINIAHKAGIYVMGHIIFGLPGQKKDLLDKTIKWLIDYDVDYAQFYCAVPYYGTQLREIAAANGWIISDDQSLYEIDHAMMRNKDLTSEEIQKMREDAFTKFYIRPSFIVKELWKYKTNPVQVISLVRDGLTFLSQWVKK